MQLLLNIPLSLLTTAGWLLDYLIDTNAPLYKDHLSTETTQLTSFSAWPL
jgi:hypothetical protein